MFSTPSQIIVDPPLRLATAWLAPSQIIVDPPLQLATAWLTHHDVPPYIQNVLLKNANLI